MEYEFGLIFMEDKFEKYLKRIQNDELILNYKSVKDTLNLGEYVLESPFIDIALEINEMLRDEIANRFILLNEVC